MLTRKVPVPKGMDPVELMKGLAKEGIPSFVFPGTTPTLSGLPDHISPSVITMLAQIHKVTAIHDSLMIEMKVMRNKAIQQQEVFKEKIRLTYGKTKKSKNSGS